MADYCMKILEDCADSKRFAAAARRRAEVFDYRTIIPQYEAIYERLLAPVGTTAPAPGSIRTTSR
jgi:glycosyltransferase involved in cell wall biosynthesis